MSTSVEKFVTAGAPGFALSTRTWERAGVLAILAATCFCYAATLHFGFVYDDLPQIVNNPRIHSSHFLPEYFVKDVWAHQEGRPQNLYRPLFLAWLLANFKSFALQAGYWHASALAMHLLMVWLVYLLARRLLPQTPFAAMLATAIFALHPSHVEAVAWISGVTEPLSGALFVSSFLCFLYCRESPQARSRIFWRTCSLVLGAGAMLAKETAVVLPAVVGCYEWMMGSEQPGSSEDSSRFRWLKLKPVALASPYAALVGVYFVLRFHALHGVAHSFSDVPLWTSILTWPRVVQFYLAQFVVPIGLGLYYDAGYACVFYIVVPMLVLGGLAVTTWWLSRRSATRLPLFLASWFLLTIAPALAVFAVVWRYDNLHDRYLYLPSVGLSVLVGHAVVMAAGKLSRARRLWLWGGVTAGLTLLALGTYRQSLDWKDNLTLYVRGSALAPHNLVAKLNLASGYYEIGRYQDAFAVAQQALQIDPNSPLALTDVAQAAYSHGDYAAAEHYYSRALTLGPPSVDQLYYLGLTRIRMGRYNEALFVLAKGIALWPGAPGYHAAMGQAVAGLGDWAAAAREYKLELKLNPASTEARSGLAEAQAHAFSASVK